MSQAAVFHGPGRAFEFTSIETPRPSGKQILVRVACCAICRSDLHTHAGRRNEPTPCVLGHEIVGTIEEFGPDAPQADFRRQPLIIGDRITWSVAASCGHCLYCDERIPQKCSTLFKYGHRRFSPSDALSGGFASHVLLQPGTAMVKLAEHVPDGIAALANCAIATAASVLREIGVITHRSIAIFGAGVLGLSACAVAKTMGVKRIAVIEPDELRREQARAFGAGEVFHPDDFPTGQFDIALELAGSQRSVEASLAAPRTGGTVVLAGTVQSTPGIAFDPEAIVKRMLTVLGVHNYTPIDLAEAVAFLETHSKPFPIAELIGPSFDLNAIDEAFAFGHAHPGQHVVVVPNGE